VVAASSRAAALKVSSKLATQRSATEEISMVTEYTSNRYTRESKEATLVAAFDRL